MRYGYHAGQSAENVTDMNYLLYAHANNLPHVTQTSGGRIGLDCKSVLLTRGT